MRWTFVADEACFAAVEEVEAMANMNLTILRLYPCQLVNNFIAPFVHTFVSNVHLRVKDPEKAESFNR